MRLQQRQPWRPLKAAFSLHIGSNPRLAMPIRCCSRAMQYQLVTPDYGSAEATVPHDAEHVADAALLDTGSQASPETDQPAKPLADPFNEPAIVPLSDEGHELAGESAEGNALGAAGADSKTRPPARKTPPSAWPNPSRTKASKTSTLPPSPARRRGIAPLRRKAKRPQANHPRRKAQAANQPPGSSGRHPSCRTLGVALRVWAGALERDQDRHPPGLGSQFNMNKASVRAEMPKPGPQVKPPAGIRPLPPMCRRPMPRRQTPPHPLLRRRKRRMKIKAKRVAN